MGRDPFAALIKRLHGLRKKTISTVSAILPWIVAPAIINFEGNFVKNNLSIFEKINIWGESKYSSRSVIGMIHYFDR